MEHHKAGESLCGGHLRSHLVLLRREDQRERGREIQSYKSDGDKRLLIKGLLEHPRESVLRVHAWPASSPPFSGDSFSIWGTTHTAQLH